MTLQNLLDDLTIARHGATPLTWPATTPADLSEAYAVALAVREQRIATGEVPAGYKVGFTNRNIWQRYNVEAPIWGTVWQSSLTFCRPEKMGGTPEEVVSLQGLSEPRIEPEIIFCLRTAPPISCTLAQLAACIDWVAHGFEIVHTHFPAWKFTAAQGVADAGLHGRLLVGQTVKVPEDIQVAELTLALSGLRLKLYGEDVLIEEGAGTNVLDGPMQALHHFVQEIRATPNAPLLKAGDVVTTGTLTDAYPVQPGQCWYSQLEATGPVAEQLKGLKLRFE